ncbi:MAG TPA: DUF5994 family protein [Microlunatus sp.]|nr:DUF5994 family protein [Microlunatus sp.]
MSPPVRPLRLQLAPEIGRGTLDGAWWPYGRDLAVEVVALAAQYPSILGHLSRIVYSSPDWAPNRRRRIQVDEAFVSIGSFPRDQAHLVVLRSVSPRVSRVLQLLVVPPEWDERAARHAMRAAAAPGNTVSGPELLDESRALLLSGLLPHHDAVVRADPRRSTAGVRR